MPIPTTTVKLHRDFEVRFSVLFVRSLERVLDKPLGQILDDIAEIQKKVEAAKDAGTQSAIFAEVPAEQAAAFVAACILEPVETILGECGIGQVYSAYFDLCGGLFASLSTDAGKA